MDKLLRFLEGQGQDASELDKAVADYMIQLASDGGTEEEVWSVMEGAYPELEDSPESKGAFSKVFVQLKQPSPPEPSPATSTAERAEGAIPVGLAVAAERAGTRKDGADVDFLREMVPHVSDRGLRYVLHHVAKGDRQTAASYLADRCTGGSSSASLRGLEAHAEAWERKELGDARKAEEAERRAQEARRRDKEERDELKGKIVGRYADEVKPLLQSEGGTVKVVVPSLTEKKKTTRYRDGKVVTTTGAKVIVEDVKPEWDGGSRGKVKTKGKRGKGFV
eukprot:g7708.t1